MRFLVRVSIPVEAGNELNKSGRIGEVVPSILGELQPEAAYFTAENGKRTAYLVTDIAEASQLPGIAEPWFLAFKATVEVFPLMTAEDLGKAGPAIAQAAEKYG